MCERGREAVREEGRERKTDREGRRRESQRGGGVG